MSPLPRSLRAHHAGAGRGDLETRDKRHAIPDLGHPMPKLRKLALALLCASIVLSPALAEARAGGSARPGGSMGYSSQGSLGSRTYNNNGGQPVQRSVTPQTNPRAAPNAARPGLGGFAQNHPFLTRLAGAFLGSWTARLLLPPWDIRGLC